jgi:hypothetical protein
MISGPHTVLNFNVYYTFKLKHIVYGNQMLPREVNVQRIFVSVIVIQVFKNLASINPIQPMQVPA